MMNCRRADVDRHGDAAAGMHEHEPLGLRPAALPRHDARRGIARHRNARTACSVATGNGRTAALRARAARRRGAVTARLTTTAPRARRLPPAAERQRRRCWPRERLDDQRGGIGKAAATIARARRDDAQDRARRRIEHRAAAEPFFDMHVFEFEIETVLRPRTHRSRKKHARFLTDDADQFVVLHVTRDRDEVALDHRSRTGCEPCRAQPAAFDREQRQIARPGAFDARAEVVRVPVDVDTDACRAGHDVRRRQHVRAMVARIDDDSGPALGRTPGAVERPYFHE